MEKTEAEIDSWFRSHGQSDLADHRIADKKRHAEVMAEEAKCAAGKPKIGMTKAEAFKTWCEPWTVNTTETAGGTREQWVYKDRGYLYFENGVLVAIQRTN